MKKFRFTYSQITALLKQAEVGTPFRNCAGNTASARRRSTGGAASSAAWMRRWCPSSRSCRTRIGA